MFTGKHPEEHGAVRHTAQIDTGHTVWEELQSDGYETGLFTNNRIISEASNIGDSFGRNYTPHYPLRRRLEESSPLFPEAYSSSEGDISGIAGNVLRSLRDEHKLRSLLNCTYEKLGGIASRAEQRYLNPDSGFKTIVGKRFTDAFLEWESQRSGPWAACVNLMDTHEPYEPLPEFDKWGDDEAWQTQHNHLPLALSEVLQGFGQDLEWEDISALESLYDGTILQADTFVSELIDTLRERGVLEETLVIITSDHGEGLGERSRIDPDVRLKNHLFGLHETLTHVPLVIQYPGQSGGSVVEQAVSLTHLPDLIRAVVRDDTATDPLTRAEVVLSSTFRLLDEEAAEYDSVGGVEKYVGPWRSVYEDQGEKVRKFAQRGEDYLTADIYGPGEVEVVSRDPHTRVRDEYGRLDNDNVLAERTSEIGEELETHLENLGYIR